MARPVILVSNDDGIASPGIKALAKALKRIGEVYVIAPDRERSAAGHSLTLHKPLRVEKAGRRIFAVNGTPTDCVNLAINGILTKRPDLVVSGINKGENLGDDVTYSGTVSAAMEGTLLDIPSFAISLTSGNGYDFKAASEFSTKLSRYILKHGLPKDTLLNVNVPSMGVLRGYKITRQGKRIYGDAIVEKVDPRGKKYYWIGGDELRWRGGRDTDFHAVANGYISITPLHLDMTNYDSIDRLRDINI